MKIFRASVNYELSYKHLDTYQLKIGMKVENNIFIKRYNDYVIIIEEGTILTQNMLNNIRKQDAVYH